MRPRGWIVGALMAGAMGLGLWQVAAEEPPAVQSIDEREGKSMFRSVAWSATGLTCSHCHADFNEKKTPDGLIRPGHSLFNSGYRTLFHKWNGETTHSLREAIRTCMVRWCTPRTGETGRGEAPAKHQVRQFMAYLRSAEMIQESKAKPIEPILIEELPSDRMLRAGDSSIGARIFRRSCVPCHLADGNGPAPSLVRNGYSRYQIAKKIRGIDNPGLKGLVMPAWSLDRLSDRELINVAAYVFQM